MITQKIESSGFSLFPHKIYFRLRPDPDVNVIHRRPHCNLAKWNKRMQSTSTTTPAELSLASDLNSLQRLSMNANIDSCSSILDPTSLHNMEVSELLKEDLGHMRQFQGNVMIGGAEW